MNQEIYRKLRYRIEEKDKLREEEEKMFFEKIEKNTLKMYYKTWSEILKKYKKSSIEDLNHIMKYKLKEKNQRKNIKFYSAGILDNSLINIDSLTKMFKTDGLTVLTSEEKAYLILEICIYEVDLRNIIESQKNNFGYLYQDKKEVKKQK